MARIRKANMMISGWSPGPYHCKLCGQQIDAHQMINSEWQEEITAAKNNAQRIGIGAGVTIAALIFGIQLPHIAPPEGLFEAVSRLSVGLVAIGLLATFFGAIGMVAAEAINERWREKKIRDEFLYL